MREQGNGFDDLLKAHGFFECQEGLAGVLVERSKHLEFMARDRYIMDFFNESELAEEAHHSMSRASG